MFSSYPKSIYCPSEVAHTIEVDGSNRLALQTCFSTDSPPKRECVKDLIKLLNSNLSWYAETDDW